MRSRILIMFCALLVIAGATSAFGSTMTFTPKPSDIGDLDHNSYYAWKITGLNVPSGEMITGASLSFVGLYDWTVEADSLYVHLMNQTLSGGQLVTTGGNTWRWSDSQLGGDNWAMTSIPQVLLFTYSDPYGGYAHKVNYTYVFTDAQIAKLQDYATSDGIVYLGFDPDCHYYNSGVSLNVTTAQVPEPGTLLLLSSGLIGLGGMGLYRRRRN